MLDAPTTAELRAAIPWVDGHADVWRLFADSDLFGRCVLALFSPYVRASDLQARTTPLLSDTARDRLSANAGAGSRIPGREQHHSLAA